MRIIGVETKNLITWICNTKNPSYSAGDNLKTFVLSFSFSIKSIKFYLQYFSLFRLYLLYPFSQTHRNVQIRKREIFFISIIFFSSLDRNPFPSTLIVDSSYILDSPTPHPLCPLAKIWSNFNGFCIEFYFFEIREFFKFLDLKFKILILLLKV